MNFENVKAEKNAYPIIISETDKCVWCEKKALITDNTYVYCSEKCRELFIDDCQKAVTEAYEEFNRDMMRRLKKNERS